MGYFTGRFPKTGLGEGADEEELLARLPSWNSEEDRVDTAGSNEGMEETLYEHTQQLCAGNFMGTVTETIKTGSFYRFLCARRLSAMGQR